MYIMHIDVYMCMFVCACRTIKSKIKKVISIINKK